MKYNKYCCTNDYKIHLKTIDYNAKYHEKKTNKFLLVGNKFMTKMHLRRPGFT